MHTMYLEGSLLMLLGRLLIRRAGCSMIHDDATPGAGDRVAVTRSTDALVITSRTNVFIWAIVAGQQVHTTML